MDPCSHLSELFLLHIVSTFIAHLQNVIHPTK